MRQLALDFGLTVSNHLDDFIVGENLELLSALEAQRAGESFARNLYLFGASGSGRTHLLQGCVESYGIGAQYIDARDCSDLSSLDHIPELLAVDNLDALDDAGQIALFNIFNRAQVLDHCLLMAGSDSPLFLQLRDDLRTRVALALAFIVVPLSDVDQWYVLKFKAQERGMTIPDVVLHYMMTHVNRDMRTLCMLLDGLDKLSFEQKRMVTLPLVRTVLAQLS